MKKSRFGGQDVKPLVAYKSLPNSVLHDQAFSYYPTHRLGHNTLSMRTARPKLSNFFSFIKICGYQQSEDYDVILAKDCRFDKTMKIYVKTDSARLQAACAVRNDWLLCYGYSVYMGDKRAWVAESFFEPMKITYSMVKKRKITPFTASKIPELEVKEDIDMLKYIDEVRNGIK